MKIVELHDVASDLSRQIYAACNGEQFLITKGGKAVLMPVPFKQPTIRRFGSFKGRIRIAADFNEPVHFSK
jgi:antitoxin (DNA-binding transcriptional repressor) of toxin-antitoxin stability system